MGKENKTIRILITGCAKTGTTLLLRLFHAFKDVTIVDGEITLSKFIKIECNTKYLIGKRDAGTILSTTRKILEESELWENQQEMIKEHDIRILNIIRDGRDVILSDDRYVQVERWIECMKQRQNLKHIITLEVTYENLVRHPNLTQKDIMDVFDLEKEHDFSDYPKFLPLETDDSIGAYKKRPIGTKSIGKDLNAYKKICTKKELKEFEIELKMIL